MSLISKISLMLFLSLAMRRNFLIRSLHAVGNSRLPSSSLATSPHFSARNNLRSRDISALPAMSFARCSALSMFHLCVELKGAGLQQEESRPALSHSKGAVQSVFYRACNRACNPIKAMNHATANAE